ncbi:putative disease resistance RPP13-like protein 1 [Oryza brachyantha]|uniref:NB-ARC domain-containing protein n=1 Tax=Oryza brachyantha TaxID=4533 RepID=J3N8H9_ORYBR|nr:putative disease resistance RPP13-like protein 1 [Oryza brachyantha]XP_040384737.1 putative disease resistance RPP13-like protein 1 [Oryza brachyantha]
MAAGVFASMAVKWALDKLSSLLAPAAASSSSPAVVWQGLEDLRKLERTMRRIQATLADAEEHWDVREESAKLRLRELRELAYGAEDVVEEYEYEVSRCRLGRSAASSSKRKRSEVNDEQCTEVGFVPVPNELAVRAGELVKRLDEMEVYQKYFSLSENDGERRIMPGIQSVRDTGCFVVEQSIVGRESDKQKVKQMLMSRQGSNVANQFSVLAIVGMGGLGKTTLAQLVYNDQTVSQSFDVRVWVYVSDHFDSKRLTKKIIVSITKESNGLSELADLQDMLAQEIMGKRLLLVLDDVWNERGDLWETFCRPFFAAQQCKVLVTTRNVAVAKLVQTMPHFTMDHLSPDECWILFERTVTAQQNVIPGNLVDIAKQIVEKCDRLPLAIKTLGSMLRYETDERRWIDVIESDLWDLDKAQNEVLPALELSYKNMPMHLKRCFLSLCLFPKDYLLDKSEVIELWQLLDILQGDERNNGDEIGSQCFDGLVERSFLQLSLNEVVMHDLIHDLACHLSGNEFFILEGNKPVKIPENARFMSIIDFHTSVQFSAPSHPLWAIVVFGEEHSEVSNPDILFLNCKNLRVLSLGGSNLGEALPRHISSLKLLRHLQGAENAPSGIYPLTNLQTIPDIEICRCGDSFNLIELRNLNQIKDQLTIRGLCNLSHVQDANQAQLVSKKNIQVLILDFNEVHCEHMLQQDFLMTEELDLTSTPEGRYENFQYEDMQQPKYVTVPHNQILETLRPHEGLRELEIYGYNCQSYPSWLGDASFSKLTYIVIISGTHKVSQQCVPTLGELPFLKHLTIRQMYYVEHIGREFCSHIAGSNCFPSLITLEFGSMRQWSKWFDVHDGDFPCLQSLVIRRCERLTTLPLDRFSSLHTLELTVCGVISIPTQPSLLQLSVFDCPELGAVDSMPELNILDIKGCPNLTAVGSLPKLKTLSADGTQEDATPHGQQPDHLPVLDTLWSIAMHTTIPASHNLEELAIVSCAGLSELPTLPSLLKLQITNCPDLSVVGSLPSLTTLSLWDSLPKDEVFYRLLNDHPTLSDITICSKTITKLSLQPPRLPSLKKLTLSCVNLQYCDGLAGLTCLDGIKISGCPKLRQQLQSPDVR